MRNYLIVGVGGALGAISRYWLGSIISAGDGFPFGTFIINLTGSFILGFFLTFITERAVVPVEWRLFIATGFLGAYTTFSSLTYEVLTLFRQGLWLKSLMYSGASLAGGLFCVWLGFIFARNFKTARFRPDFMGFNKLPRQVSTEEEINASGAEAVDFLPFNKICSTEIKETGSKELQD